MAISLDTLLNKESIHQSMSCRHALEAFYEICVTYDFNGVFYATNILPFQNGKGKSRSYVKMSFKWKAWYIMKGYLSNDPVLKWCVECNHPATWSTIAKSLDNEQHPIWQDAAKFNMVDGISMPILLGKQMSVFSIASPEPICAQRFSFMLPLGRYFATKIHCLENGVEMPVIGDKRFNRNCLNILNLVLQSLSIDEIADATRYSVEDINQHLEECMHLTATDNHHKAALVISWSGLI